MSSSLAEIREQNLARNSDFWRQLQSIDINTLTGTDNNDNNDNNHNDDVIDASFDGMEDTNDGNDGGNVVGRNGCCVVDIDALTKRVCTHYVGRDKEITQLMRTLHRVRVCPQPPILICGAAGTGKHSIARDCMQTLAAHRR
jgi:ATP-dependent Clp protease ATP-binding subunit ClpA